MCKMSVSENSESNDVSEINGSSTCKPPFLRAVRKSAIGVQVLCRQSSCDSNNDPPPMDQSSLDDEGALLNFDPLDSHMPSTEDLITFICFKGTDHLNLNLAHLYNMKPKIMDDLPAKKKEKAESTELPDSILKKYQIKLSSSPSTKEASKVLKKARTILGNRSSKRLSSKSPEFKPKAKIRRITRH